MKLFPLRRAPLWALAWVLGVAAAADPLLEPPANGTPPEHSSEAPEGGLPDRFAAEADAIAFADRLFAGGEVQTATLGDSRYLLLIQCGSGVPIVRLALYRADATGWSRLREVAPPTRSERLTLFVQDHNLFLRGADTGQLWPLHPPAAAPVTPPLTGPTPENDSPAAE